MRWVIGVAGATPLATVLWDAFETIILPRRVTGRFRLGKLNKELVDSIRPEIWEHLEKLMAQRARGHAG